MKASVLELIDTLEQETSLVKELVLALQEDQQRIIKQDVVGLEESNLHKEERVVRFGRASTDFLRARPLGHRRLDGLIEKLVVVE